MISIIIPVFNESMNIGWLIRHLRLHDKTGACEIIVVDGGSTDDTPEIAEAEGAFVYQSSVRRRAAQMNLGASKAKGNILYFVHADSRPPETYVRDILHCTAKGDHLGCYRLRFNSRLRMLKFNAWYTRFNGAFSGGGDQSLFVLKPVFDLLEGFDENRPIMEDFDFVRRAKRGHRFCVMKGDILISARKYESNGYLRVNAVNLIVMTLDLLRVSPQRIDNLYRKLLRPYPVQREHQLQNAKEHNQFMNS
jgi:rSAM/selenodomain-associated transferase 2